MAGSSQEDRISQLFTQGEELETACEFEKVVDIAKEILKIDGSNVRALLLGAGSLVSKGEESDDKLAREWYLKAIELEPDDGFDKFFAFAQIAEGSEAIDLYERGIRLLDKAITRLNKGEEKDKLKGDKFEAVRSLVEVHISDVQGNIYLNKARELILKLLKEDGNNFMSYDIFLLAQVYDKLGPKYKSEIHELCEAATRRALTEEAENVSEEKLGIFLSKFASFCLDYQFFNTAKHIINRLGLVGGKTADYLSLKAMFYRLRCDRMLKKAHFYTDSCLELIEDLEEEGEADSLDEVKETMEELKSSTPLKLNKMFADKSETNGNKPISAKRYQKLLEGEKKRIVELCKLDIGSDEPQAMDIEN
ncbi:unnamed protein product [Allacma fusca]|uniref:Uncharacterized protein n=1 Tax=Allacma fusca TaxID=39272 RepID=A0A8J2JGS7_9HEXA|nr:unnamed protein product [Allacma fusca]